MSTTAVVPTIPFGPTRISRLIIGDNPIYGYSHFNHLLAQHQIDSNSSEEVMTTLRRAEKAGINAWQNTITERSTADLERYREQGGTIQYFCLSTGSWYDHPEGVEEAAKLNPIGMSPHGGIGDRCLREDKLDVLKDLTKRIRATGCQVGVSCHNPRLVEIVEDEDWDVDYFMTALYYLAGASRRFQEQFGHPPLHEVYLREDRDLMCEVIRKASRPCIAYKVLAAGRAIGSKDQIRSEIRFALENVKSTDSLLIGMYQKLNDQIGENAAMVAEICAELDEG